ncbi:MAG: PD40 domain-containing protein, partial [Prevotella sp.]|nr:PD40 domain-containing protein [Prevotella sp.]
MKKLVLSFLALVITMTISAQDNPLWMRYCAISPDGSTIVFSYQGDLFTVPVSGGNARQLTTNAAYDSQPVWSPDGQQIAFTSAREGSLDVYLINKEGGVPRRLTTHSGSEVPLGFLDNQTVLLQSNILPTAQSAFFTERMPQVYQVSTQGGRMRLFSSVTMDNLSVAADGRILYHDRKGMEDSWRKHQTSAVVRDVWLKTKDDHFSKLTDTKCENRNPVWAADGKSFYYLSEASGSMNVYKKNIDGTGLRQLTQLKNHPVR